MTGDIKTETLRYLGHKNQTVPPEIDLLIDRSIEELKNLCRPRHVIRIFDTRFEDSGVRLGGAVLFLPGKDISEHIRDCAKCALMAATLGIEADNLIREAESYDMMRAVILDAVCAALIEEECDRAEQELRAEYKKITTRYSPGYGDLPIELQPDILSLLNAQRAIGLTCTQSGILLPRKSVTAIIGIYNDKGFKR